MLEAAQRGPRFTISLKRSTQYLQLSTSCRVILDLDRPSSGFITNNQQAMIDTAASIRSISD